MKNPYVFTIFVDNCDPIQEIKNQIKRSDFEFEYITCKGSEFEDLLLNWEKMMNFRLEHDYFTNRYDLIDNKLIILCKITPENTN